MTLYQQYFPKGAGSYLHISEIKGGEQEAKRFIDSAIEFSLFLQCSGCKNLWSSILQAQPIPQLNAEELKACDISPNTVRLSNWRLNIDDIIEG